MEHAYRQYQEWLESPLFDEATKLELLAIKDQPEEIKDRFYKDLSFGTGGLRGVLGAGTNRINRYTVRRATQGLANYILQQPKQAAKGVAIAYDSRRMSKELAMETALCLNANNIPAYLFDALRPTPVLSYTVRHLGCIAGVVITASHNPAQYNGYKVYWEDGGQITPPRDQEIIQCVRAVHSFADAKMLSREEALGSGLLRMIGAEIDGAYIEELKKLCIQPELMREFGGQLTVVYTPLHGTGFSFVPRILQECGFTNVHVVPQQAQPDGDFPTVVSPNPEDRGAFTLALALAEQVHADLILATDPDADRLGAYVRGSDGVFHELNGNMSGMLLCEYQLSMRSQLGTLPDNGAIVKTIVTGNMSKAAAAFYHTALIETLTGFKYIGEQILRFEQTNSHEFLFGYEESYGCLIGTSVRDKDAIVAVMALCEAAAYYASKHLTLWDQMLALYQKYGYYREQLLSCTFAGAEGAAHIEHLMHCLRSNPPRSLGNPERHMFAVQSVTDYLMPEKTGLPKSNVLYFTLTDDAWCCIRPSGTEPKIKCYLGVKGQSMQHARELSDDLADALYACFTDAHTPEEHGHL